MTSLGDCACRARLQLLCLRRILSQADSRHLLRRDKVIHVLPVDLVLPILRLRHAIHVTFGGSDLQPLTVDELSLVEGLMSGKFSIPSAKEARALLKGAASSS